MENKSNKSKKLLVIVAMVLMVALIAGMGAFTYSRYITSGTTGSQNATAAKWGVVVNVDATNLFSKKYALLAGTGSESLAQVTTSTESGIAVNATGDTSVVAPGATGSMTISVSGSAEVKSKLTITNSGITTEFGFPNYNPIKWTLTKTAPNDEGTSVTNTLVDKGTLEAVLHSLESFETFNAGKSYDVTYTITWEWVLGSGNDTNAKDTLIGYKAAGKTYADIKDITIGTTKLGDLITDGETEEAKETAYNDTFFQLKIPIELTVSVEQVQ